VACSEHVGDGEAELHVGPHESTGAAVEEIDAAGVFAAVGEDDDEIDDLERCGLIPFAGKIRKMRTSSYFDWMDAGKAGAWRDDGGGPGLVGTRVGAETDVREARKMEVGAGATGTVPRKEGGRDAGGEDGGGTAGDEEPMRYGRTSVSSSRQRGERW
jgi:hypothetical protein